MLPATLKPALLPVLILLSSCSNFKQLSGSNGNGETNLLRNVIDKPKPVTTSFRDADTSSVFFPEATFAYTPQSIFKAPTAPDGSYMLSPGYYEGDFKSFCLHPGTHGPSEGDGYLYAPLKGSRKDIIQSILRNSSTQTSISQKEVQLLLWAVISNTNFKDLSSQLKITASQLLSVNQVYTLNGGALGLIPREVSSSLKQRLPSSVRNIMEAENNLRRLFTTGREAYEDYEHFAVLMQPAKIDRPQFKRGRWCKHPDGYFIRFYPSGYKRTKVEIYVPGSDLPVDTDSTRRRPIYFDPFDLVAVPANTGAQRIGIGGPWEEIFGKEGRTPPAPREPVFFPPIPERQPRQQPPAQPPTPPAPTPQTHPGLPGNQPPSQPSHPGLPGNPPSTRPPRTSNS